MAHHICCSTSDKAEMNKVLYFMVIWLKEKKSLPHQIVHPIHIKLSYYCACSTPQTL